MSNTLGNLIIDELEDLLEPVTLAVDDEFWRDRLLLALGIDPSSGATPPLLNTLRSVIEIKRTLADLTANPSVSFDSVSRLLDATGSLLSTIGSIGTAADSVEALRGIGTDFVQMLVTRYLAAEHPLLFRLCVLLAVAERAEEGKPTAPVVVGDEVVRFPMEIDRIHPSRLIALLRDPVAVLKAEYINSLATVADAEAMADKLFPRVAAVLTQLDVPCMYGLQDRDRPLLGDAASFVDHALTIYFEEKAAGATADAGFMLAFSSADRGDLGLVVCPFGALKFSKQIGSWTIELDFTAEVEGVAYGHHGITLAASPSTTQVLGRLLATLAAPNVGPAFVFGSPTGTRLEVGGAHITAETALSEARQAVALSAAVTSAAIVIAPGDGDGFLRSILPAEGLQAKFDLGLEWSNDRGLTFHGAGSLDATLPVALSIRDMLIVPTIHLSLQARETALVAEVSATIGVSIGPVHAVVERVGLAAAVTFPETGGNLGIADLALGFKPPSGVGLSIDAAGVTGGGFLSLDTDKGQYAGVVQLQTNGIVVKGLGLIATRLPNNAKGFSLLVIISAEDFKPVPLGMGFSLTGVGGLLALNRTFNEDVLRAGLKNHALDSVLFPTDPIRNAPQILSTLQNVFPVASGHHLFGPMARITWGTPPLITADLGLVLEFGKRLRLLILGQITAILPRRENDLIRLQMDTIGLIDFDQGTAALDATLYDSRLLKKFVLTGDMAMRLRWEGSPSFALAIGGMHPAFNPPPNFPKLERISLNLAAGDNLRLRCESYFALTANTVQFGARTELYAKAAGFSIQGETGYDVLIQLDPFQFLADFYAQVQLKRGSHNLFKIRVEGALAGPRPLHLKGKATFEVLWMDVTLRIDKTLVAGEKPPRPAPVDVLPLLKEALGQPDNWVARLPDGQRSLVTLRSRQEAANEVPLHPLGTLTVKQNVVPLNLDIARFGQTTPTGARRFTITSVSLGGQSQAAPPPVRDFFAPAQFFEMSDDEKLSRPSFEALPAGVSFGAEAFTFSDDANDWLEVDAIAFDTITVDPETHASHPSSPTEAYAMSPELLDKQARFGAAGASALRRLGSAKYRTARVGHKVVKEGWSIVDTINLSVPSVPGMEAGKPVAYSEAAEALRHLQQADPAQARGLRILRLSELQGATPSHT